MTVKGRTYVACLNCGSELDYDWDSMTLGRPTPDNPVIAEEMGR